MKTLHRIDLRWQQGPTLVVWTDPDDPTDQHAYTLTPSETYALIRRLVGYLAALHPNTDDRTAETAEANPEYATHLYRQEGDA